MKGKILITLTTKEKAQVDDLIVKSLVAKGYEVVTNYSNAMLDEEELIEKIKDVDGYIVGLEKVNERVFQAANNLKVVCKFGVGTDNIDKRAAAKFGVKVANCPGLNSNSVAELVLGIMISLVREIPQLDAQMKQGNWVSSMGTELTGKTLGIIGMGNIGKRLIQLVQGFQMKILVYDVFQDHQFAQRYGVEFAPLKRVIQEGDFLSLHLPLTDDTRNLIDEAELKAMKKSAYLINTARGGIVNEDALYTALEKGELAGAAIDAFIHEPPFGSPLVKNNRLIALPHIGAATYEATERIAYYAMGNVLNVLEGKDPLSEVKE
jgi:D-3-phosphoglycerate dehydrogenase